MIRTALVIFSLATLPVTAEPMAIADYLATISGKEVIVSGTLIIADSDERRALVRGPAGWLPVSLALPREDRAKVLQCSVRERCEVTVAAETELRDGSVHLVIYELREFSRP